ncbi:MAG: TlpA family protein disulfide reductase [Planctomycetaceae bacterium]|jgi:thiol-disulfide isomerase/thioredoxin|nr:TlpA family protein disulfide reductase [Planctomycetaceae bacterium]
MKLLYSAVFFVLLFSLLSVFVSADDAGAEPWRVESTRSNVPVQQKPRNLWADTNRGSTIADILGEPVIEAERWVNEPPKDFAGKFVLVEVWATWCPPCRRSLALLEYFHEKYKNELAVVSICETDEKALKEMKGPTTLDGIKVPLAVDTHRRFANALGVYGIPHAVLIDPVYGAVVWEGMPTQIGYELSDAVMSKILGNLKNPAVKEKLPKEAPFSFKVCPPDPNKKYRQPPASIKSSDEW